MLGKIIVAVDSNKNVITLGKVIEFEKLNSLENRLVVADIRKSKIKIVAFDAGIIEFERCTLQILPGRIRVSAVKNHKLYVAEKYLYHQSNFSTNEIIDDLIYDLIISTTE